LAIDTEYATTGLALEWVINLEVAGAAGAHTTWGARVVAHSSVTSTFIGSGRLANAGVLISAIMPPSQCHTVIHA
ncbi:hypothetical protein LCGC14_3023540, partial [marine sediment metagenome]